MGLCSLFRLIRAAFDLGPVRLAALKRPDDWRTSLTQPQKQTFSEDAQSERHMKTNKGELAIRLMPAVAPMHVSSTIFLARSGFYDGLKFHHVIPGFMAQGGDPLGTGRGGPGYKYAGAFDPKLKHDKSGRLSMANAGPATDGPQFFLTFVPTNHLDGKHSIFGEVISGVETVKALEACASKSGARTEPLMVEHTWIVVTPAPPAPDKPAAPPEEKKKEGK